MKTRKVSLDMSRYSECLATYIVVCFLFACFLFVCSFVCLTVWLPVCVFACRLAGCRSVGLFVC